MRSNSFGARLRSGSLSNFSNTFKNGNARNNQHFNDFDDVTTQDDGTLSDYRARSVHDLHHNSRTNDNWQMPSQQFGPPFGFVPNQPFQYHVILKNHSHFNRLFNVSLESFIFFKFLIHLYLNLNNDFLFSSESHAANAMYELQSTTIMEFAGF